MEAKSKNRRFPLFIDLNGKELLFVGGGRIALRRVQTLLEFGPDILVIAREVCQELLELEQAGRIRIIKKEFADDDIKRPHIVFAVTDDPGLNDRVYRWCRKNHILVNVASDQEKCDFFYPAIVFDEELVIGITGDGRNHKRVKQKAAWLRKIIGKGECY